MNLLIIYNLLGGDLMLREIDPQGAALVANLPEMRGSEFRKTLDKNFQREEDGLERGIWAQHVIREVFVQSPVFEKLATPLSVGSIVYFD